MIKEIISNLTHDKIKLSQALTETKVIASKVKNDRFKLWITKELEGYDSNDEMLPNYRKIYSPINVTAQFPFGRTQTFPVILPDKLQKEIGKIIFTVESLEPISIIENHIITIKGTIGHIKVHQHQLELISKLYKNQLEELDGVIIDGKREIGKVHLQNIIEQTKQKLIDILVKLDEEFPDLSINHKMTIENSEKIQNIITNNIYGNPGQMNIAAGQHVVQSSNETNINFDSLKELGVENEHIAEIKQIFIENQSDKNTLKKKTMNWLGRVTSSFAARGLYDNIPVITDFIEKLL